MFLLLLECFLTTGKAVFLCTKPKPTPCIDTNCNAFAVFTEVRDLQVLEASTAMETAEYLTTV